MDNIKDIVKGVIGKIAEKKPDVFQQIEDVLKETLKEKELEHAKLSGYRDGVLLITVESSMWLYQVKIQQKKILNNLQRKIPEVKSIKFKIG